MHLSSLRNLCVGVDLFSRPVARQVSSAQVSLTSVFGMGTGGPSPLKTLTMAGAEGLEPSARGFGDHCSTN